jgi:hypothetical protein
MPETNIKKVTAALHKKILGGAEAAVQFATNEVAVDATTQMKELVNTKRREIGHHKVKVKSKKTGKYLMTATGNYRKKTVKEYAKGHPPEPPHLRTGSLKRNIKYKIKKGYGGSYIATIAPYSIYARRLEFGGGNWKSGTRYPFVAPTAKIMRANDRARNIYVKALHKELSK